MENEKYDKMLERLIEDALKYGSGLEAALDHLNMGFVHLYRHLNGNDRHNLLNDLEEFNSRLKNFLVDEGNNV
jgi:hypothetical protein